mmetsp:Transcript_22577/g.26766  ORF Transcript_22577/g.26766 Transcript_22577/m.26766 type:complete len:81 (-) Transcript_22577:172-414(-)|eukprot:CAMPEP_0198250854 /NCGR_PEP_ID=MMETSP1447-20131203/1881_1 /TAXON_ID=420782 /ORGANISM="Chaetoceros dichaeta, Strain CCMP1751" /LENGTH=80 /DNA_ID=CAMNT_0043935751 /DNA_START=119 /DNA_END=361 /DNA_ORIENTATION=+
MGCTTSKQQKDGAEAHDPFNNLNDSLHVLKLVKPGKEKKASFVPREAHVSRKKLAEKEDKQEEDSSPKSPDPKSTNSPEE